MKELIAMCLFALTKLPVERLFIKKHDPMEAVGKLSEVLKTKQLAAPSPQSKPASAIEEGESSKKVAPSRRVTTGETIAYQKRELGKEILLLEKHLQQKCKIGGVACDCCEKHPIVIEALAQESLGMSTNPVFNDIIVWIRGIAPMTTEAASQSGDYDDKYPEMAVAARIMRKSLMGTEEVNALLDPEQRKKVSDEVTEILDKAMTKQGGTDDDRESRTM